MTAGPEKDAWRSLQRAMAGHWDAQRHEDRYASGIADVSWAARGVDGWIELKALPTWPVRPDTKVAIGLERHQAEWLTTRGRWGGGRVWVLLRADRDWLLFHWTDARALAADRYTRANLLRRTAQSWGSSIDPGGFLDVITTRG